VDSDEDRGSTPLASTFALRAKVSAVALAEAAERITQLLRARFQFRGRGAPREIDEATSSWRIVSELTSARLADDATFNFESYAECFISENLVRKYIDEKKLTITPEAEAQIKEFPVAGKYALATGSFETQSKPADAAEQINEANSF
jgi:uncharacterized protein YajQ (UPF0234 family)